MLHLFAQVSGSDWIAPVSGTAAVGFLVALARWLATMLVTEMGNFKTAMATEMATLKATIIERSRAQEMALDHNTRANLLAGLATDFSNVELRNKLKACMDELDRKEARDKMRQDKAG